MYIDDFIVDFYANPEDLSPPCDLSDYEIVSTPIQAWNKGLPHSQDQLQLIRQRVANGDHNFCGPENNAKRVRNGTHHFLGGDLQRKNNKKRIADGTHNLLGPEHALKRMRDGTSPILHMPTVTCPHCSKSGKIGPMKRWHFDYCKRLQ